jgi:SAM-dependent methyltransferase
MKLVDYYNETVKQNDEQTAGWGSIYYGVLTKVINDNNYKNVAEVGIGYGTHAKYVLKTTSVSNLILVDPTKYYPNDGFATDIMSKTPEVAGNNFNELYDLINKELSPWKERYTWFRTESLNVTEEQVPNESLDCVFVDGDHSYEAVSKDLMFWWQKVRPGGQLLGDDYWMSDVAKAVHEFAEAYKLKLDFLYKTGSDYKIFRFYKE